jgi:hypothetical protein
MGSIKGEAEELGIHLMFIRPRSTDKLQPLHRTVFGTLNATCRPLLRKHVADHPIMVVKAQTAVQFLMLSW